MSNYYQNIQGNSQYITYGQQPNYQYAHTNYQRHAQTQINKQKVSLLQDQNASNTIMCRILSELENLVWALQYQGKKYFGFYATIPKNFQDIINQILIQMQIFESSFKSFKKANPGKQYIFPNNLQYSNIIDIVNDWKAFLTKKYNETKNSMFLEVSRYYDDFINIINEGNLSRSFKKEYDNLGKNSPPIDPNELRRIMNAGATATCYMNEKFSEIEEEVAKKGDYKINVVLNGDRKDNRFYNNLDNYDEALNNFKKDLENNLFNMLAYLEKFAILSMNPNLKIQPKYSKRIAINTEDKSTILKKYLEFADSFYSLHVSDEAGYKLPDNDINIICNDINCWRKYISNVEVKRELDNAINLMKRKESIR